MGGLLQAERTCIGCRRKGRKSDFLRIARVSLQHVCADLSGTGPGRGAYVCSNACLKKAMGNGRLEQALKTSIDACDKDRLEECATSHFSTVCREGEE